MGCLIHDANRVAAGDGALENPPPSSRGRPDAPRSRLRWHRRVPRHRTPPEHPRGGGRSGQDPGRGEPGAAAAGEADRASAVPSHDTEGRTDRGRHPAAAVGRPGGPRDPGRLRGGPPVGQCAGGYPAPGGGAAGDSARDRTGAPRVPRRLARRQRGHHRRQPPARGHQRWLRRRHLHRLLHRAGHDRGAAGQAVPVGGVRFAGLLRRTRQAAGHQRPAAAPLHPLPPAGKGRCLPLGVCRGQPDRTHRSGRPADGERRRAHARARRARRRPDLFVDLPFIARDRRGPARTGPAGPLAGQRRPVPLLLQGRPQPAEACAPSSTSAPGCWATERGAVRRRGCAFSTGNPASPTRSAPVRGSASGRPDSRRHCCRPGSDARRSRGRTDCRCRPPAARAR